MKKHYLVVAVILFASCNNKITDDESLIFSLHRGGSWINLDENLKITASTTHYSISYHEIGTWEPKNHQTEVKTSDKQWKFLARTFDLETFKKIKDGPCRSCVDGFETMFSVTINGKTYSFSNGDDDEHYKQMQDFFDAIIEQADNFSTRK